MGLFVCLIVHGFTIAYRSRDRLGALIATGVVTMLAVQIFLNIGMTVGLLPIIGLPLPLMSYGGSSLVMTFLCLGFLMNVRMRRFKLGVFPPCLRDASRAGARRCGLISYQSVDRGGEIARSYGFGYVGVHASGKTLRCIALHGVGGYGNNRYVGTGHTFLRPDGGGSFQAVHLRHLHVHEHQIKGLLRQGTEDLFPRAHHDDCVAPLLQCADNEPLVHHVVFGEQDVQVLPGSRPVGSGHEGRGRVLGMERPASSAWRPTTRPR